MGFVWFLPVNKTVVFNVVSIIVDASFVGKFNPRQFFIDDLSNKIVEVFSAFKISCTAKRPDYCKKVDFFNRMFKFFTEIFTVNLRKDSVKNFGQRLTKISIQGFNFFVQFLSQLVQDRCDKNILQLLKFLHDLDILGD